MTFRPLDGVFVAAKAQAKAAGKFAVRPSVVLTSLAIVSLSSTAVYSTSVTINTNNSISYSQGVQIIAPCDPDGIGVDLDIAFATSRGVFVLTERYQKLTGIHRDCYSKTTSGSEKRMTIRFYEGSVLQLQLIGTMPVSNAPGYSFSGDSNTLAFGRGTNSDDAFDVVGSCSGTTPSSTGSNNSSLLCGLDYTWSNNWRTQSNYRQASKTWGTGCANVPGQPSGFSGACRAWNIAYSSDRIVIEID